ncbi:MAG TPA: CRISPR-associated RAMP protein Csx10 [Cyanobacteria bacterium UBA12227]|nr:CRISPR-associated RAMP protein Csx10 [Cyanobacteria bacterium UBA12227]HAX89731.1 CRISPR-associated RAMP protein Csx10 [Cyanobacteria bacterium UBA11370]HBY77999.1 CRISPR-associated RAMP protein Csx10 [Cyanobacteria bacterium UBA11148]
MKEIELIITALSPLAIGLKKPGSVSEAGDYIPGSVMRGAMASKMIQQSNLQNPDLTANGGDFQTLFLSENPAIFRNAYPASSDSEAEVKVLPATALSSKTNPGFKPKGYGVFDSLIDRFCADSYGHPYDPNCPKDGGRVEPYTGFYSQKKDKKYKSHSVSKRLLTRVGINRSRATAEEQILYSIEVLNETQEKKPVVYRSSIIVEDDNLADLLTGFINNNTKNFRLGGSASRGLGRVEIITKELVDAKIDVSDRIAKFTDALRKRWEKWQILGNPLEELPGDRTYFTLDLQSDAILTENWRRTTVISEAMLQQFAAVEDSSLKLEAAYSSYDYKSGWNAAWGLMKDVELITNKGGVYLFSTTEDKNKVWIEALEKLERKGVGDRTCEGFGQIQVCNDFHLVFREDAV